MNTGNKLFKWPFQNKSLRLFAFICCLIQIPISFSAEPQEASPPETIIEQYIVINDRLYDETVDISRLKYGMKDINGDGLKDWYLYMPAEPFEVCRTEVFIKKDNGFCYAGSEWMHTLNSTKPSLICNKEYIFSKSPVEVVHFVFGASYAIGNDAMEIKDIDAKEFIRGGKAHIGFSINYRTGRKDSVFSFKLILPNTAGRSRMPGYEIEKTIQTNGSVIFTHTKKLKIGLNNINEHIQPEKNDPPGLWIIEFYFDDKLIRRREFYVK